MTDHDQRQAIPVIDINLDDVQEVPDEALDVATERELMYRLSFRDGVQLELEQEGHGWRYTVAKVGVVLAVGWIRGTRVEVIAAIQRIVRDLPAAL